MNTCPLRRAALCAFTFPILIAAAAQAQDWKWDREPAQSVALKRGDTIVWQFRYDPDQPKPSFHPVALPDGRVLTWDRPPDHQWHHGLWFSWKYLNGVNYWEPDAKTGKPPGRTEWSDVEITTRADHTARIDMDLTYRPVDGQPVMTERRTIAISAPDEQGQYHFDWTGTFTAAGKDVVLDRTPLEGEPGGQAWGGYAGLSIRLTQALADRRADSTSGPVEFNRDARHRSKAWAMDYSGVIDGREGGVAVCDHPDNLHHPTPWYVIRADPMSFFTPAVLCYGPHTLEASRSFTLRYRVLVHPGRWDADRLKRECERFVRDSPR